MIGLQTALYNSGLFLILRIFSINNQSITNSLIVLHIFRVKYLHFVNLRLFKKRYYNLTFDSAYTTIIV